MDDFFRRINFSEKWRKSDFGLLSTTIAEIEQIKERHRPP